MRHDEFLATLEAGSGRSRFIGCVVKLESAARAWKSSFFAHYGASSQAFFLPRDYFRSPSTRSYILNSITFADSGQVGVIRVPATNPAAQSRIRRLSEGGRTSRRQTGRWTSSTSIYPSTKRGPSGGTGRVKVRRAHRNGQSPGHDSRLRTSVYGIPRWEVNGGPARISSPSSPEPRPDPPRAGCLRNARP